WSPLFDIDAPRMDGRDELNMPFDSLDQFLMKNDESEMLEKLYDECLQLIDGV
nr:homeodomain-like protein [Tanacetum cinerariifolium]